MIPYDDLVAALSSWRARQGLPVAQLPASSSGGVAAPMPASHSSGGFAAMPGSGPARTSPPPAPRGYTTNPPPLLDAEPHDEHLDVDAALIEEAPYDDGEDPMRFAGVANEAADGEATAIGGMPERDAFGGPTNSGRDGNDW